MKEIEKIENNTEYRVIDRKEIDSNPIQPKPKKIPFLRDFVLKYFFKDKYFVNSDKQIASRAITTEDTWKKRYGSWLKWYSSNLKGSWSNNAIQKNSTP